MQTIDKLMPLREYCRQNKWPRLPQWHHWIYRRNPVALKCVKRIGGRYMIDLEALKNYIEGATLDETSE